MDFWELGSGRIRVTADRRDLRALELTEREILLELDSQLWGGETPVDIERLRRPDRTAKEASECLVS